MKLPIIFSVILIVVATMAVIFVADQSFDLTDKTTIVVYIVTALGSLISAVFFVYGYFVNLSVFKESQKPILLLRVNNDRKILEETSENVHQTVIDYANLSQNECRGLNIDLSLVRNSETIKIPRLFSNPMDMGPNDHRCRDFPTLVYFRENGIPEAVIKNLDKYKLKASYSYTFMGEEVTSHYYYIWDSKKEWWNIL